MNNIHVEIWTIIQGCFNFFTDVYIRKMFFFVAESYCKRLKI